MPLRYSKNNSFPADCITSRRFRCRRVTCDHPRLFTRTHARAVILRPHRRVVRRVAASCLWVVGSKSRLLLHDDGSKLNARGATVWCFCRNCNKGQGRGGAAGGRGVGGLFVGLLCVVSRTTCAACHDIMVGSCGCREGWCLDVDGWCISDRCDGWCSCGVVVMYL